MLWIFNEREKAKKIITLTDTEHICQRFTGFPNTLIHMAMC